MGRNIVLWVFSIVTTAGGLAAQRPAVDEVSCLRCEIVLEPVLTLGGLDSPGVESIGMLSSVAVDRRGRILVAAWPGYDITVFDSTGVYLRTVGRRGQGPGEYRLITTLAVGPRFVHVFDVGVGRTVLNEDFDVVRTDRFPGQVNSATALDSDEVVFFAELAMGRSVGRPFHRITLSGAIESFGGTGGVIPGRQEPWEVAATGSTMWGADKRKNGLVHWDLKPPPRRIQSFQRSSVWFDQDNPPGMSWPRSLLKGIHVDSLGVWVIGQAVDPDWTDRYTESGRPPEVPPSTYYDGVVELVSHETGETIARSRLDHLLNGFASGSDLIVRYRESEDGIPYIDLMKPRLVRHQAGLR